MLFPSEIKTAEQFFDPENTRMIDSLYQANDEEMEVISLAVGVPFTEVAYIDAIGNPLIQIALNLN